MATEWKVNKMIRNASTGGVELIHYECSVVHDDYIDCKSVEAGKISCSPDEKASDFIAFDDLTEADVLGWVYTNIAEDGETGDEAKLRIETERASKVAEQASKKTAKSEGCPWATYPEMDNPDEGD